MNAIPIYEGHPWSPYFVFIKNTEMTDRNLLEALGLKTYVTISTVDSRFDYLAIGRDPYWTHILDNFGYSHWHSDEFRNAIVKLGSNFDIFTFSVGDTDMSFDFQLYRRGHLVRSFVWEDLDYSGGRLKEQSGASLEGEEFIPCGKDPVAGLWRVASAQGIKSDYDKLPLKIYAPTPDIPA